MHFALNKLMLKLIANECKKKSTTRANAKTRRKVSIDRTNKNFRCECTKSHQPKSRQIKLICSISYMPSDPFVFVQLIVHQLNGQQVSRECQTNHFHSPIFFLSCFVRLEQRIQDEQHSVAVYSVILWPKLRCFI